MPLQKVDCSPGEMCVAQEGPCRDTNCPWSVRCRGKLSLMLHQILKHDSKSFYAYVQSKQKVQDKVGPLEGIDGNIITEEFLMAENLNEYFSLVFTREDISILPVLETKFEGRE